MNKKIESIKFICDNSEILIKTVDGSWNVESNSQFLFDEENKIINTNNLRLCFFPDGQKKLSLQELSYTRSVYFKKDWDEVGKLLVKM